MVQEQRSGTLAGRKVLIIEDEYFLADDLRRAFLRIDAIVIGPFRDVSDGQAAVASHPDLAGAILDVNLDGTMVFPLADVLRGRGVPLVFTTGYDERAIPEAYRDVPRCEKPVNADDVVTLLAAGRDEDG